MRDILFRGKRVDNEEWVYGNLITVYSYGEIVSTSIMGQSTVAENIAVRFDTVGQYTGLFDKNMNKVFEGDKVCVETLSSSCKPIKMSGVIELTVCFLLHGTKKSTVGVLLTHWILIKLKLLAIFMTPQKLCA